MRYVTPKRLIFSALALALAVAPGCQDDDPVDDDTMMADTTGGDTGDDTSTGDDTMMVEDTTPGVDPGLRGANNPPTLGAQVDRAGRAAISTALVATFEADADIAGAAKDAYNAASPDSWGTFADGIAGNLAILDAIDANCGNQLLADDDNADGRYATLASILSDDQLYVNSGSGTCGVYLGLEAEIVGAIGEGDGGCGGRMPADDVIDRSYSVLAAGILTGVDDTITEDDKGFDDTFPFLKAN